MLGEKYLMKKVISFAKCDFCNKSEGTLKKIADINDNYLDDDRLVCNRCLKDEMIFYKCQLCGESFLNEDLIEGNDGYLYCSEEHKEEAQYDSEGDIGDYTEFINKD